MGKKKATPSIIFTAILVLGMVIALCGLIVTLLGAGHAVDFSAKVGNVELKTTSTGLVLLSLGLFIDGFIATRLPAGVSVFEVRKPTLLEYISSRAIYILAAAVVAGVLCILTLNP